MRVERFRILAPLGKTMSAAAMLPLFAAAGGANVAAVDFNEHIRPILNQNCTACHGGVKAAGDISFVYRESATKIGKKSGRPVIVPGNPDASELIVRVTSTDKDYRMPPADHGAALPADKIALLRQWISQGAPWQDHWAFVAPQPQPVPVVREGTADEGGGREDGSSSRLAITSSVPAGPSAIDAFVRARLERAQLAPAPEASRTALLRRVSLDLTGLPPTPQEIAAFVRDRTPNAFERQVDRLLASPHFGERWTSPWLDLARYGDTKGYERDPHREVWKYREWLVDAFNRNLPYDRFLIEQLAGDLLPNATIDQHIATGFHRQTQVNDEDGTDDEEYRIIAVADRVATTWHVANAVTFNCVQCHSHPYDPIQQREYYQFFAVFNNTQDADFSHEHPTLRVPDNPARNDEAWRLRREVETLRHEVVAAGMSLERERAQWAPLAVAEARATPDASLILRDHGIRADGTLARDVRYDLTVPIPALSLAPITAVRFESAPDDEEKTRHTPERGFIVTRIELALAHPDGSVVPLGVGRFFPDTENFTTIATEAVLKPQPTEPPASAEPAAGAQGGTGIPSVVRSGNHGQDDRAPKPEPPETRDVTLDFHFSAHPTIDRPRWIVAALREPILAPPGSSLRVTVVHGRNITGKPAPVRRLRLEASVDPRWNALGRDPGLARRSARVTDALAELAKIPGTDLPVMAELAAPEARQTRLFARGNFLDKTGDPLAPGVPKLFPQLPAGPPVNRLSVARWFFQPGQPLTARVAVNRFWEQLFGIGLVATLEDFGSVGEKPSHPELLDWLALHFERDLRWNMKALLRELVLSATYRQDARMRPGLAERDPQNRLLARGPRQRLTAEMVRDQALAASGLLSRKVGGPPVMPPQPPGVWQTVYNKKSWIEAEGEDRHRRALYTFWKRGAAYPSFLSFDLPTRELCAARRTPTNTPLQALVTLNDVVYQEAADALAQHALRAVGDSATPEAAIAQAFERVISRRPTPEEAQRLRKLYDQVLAAALTIGEEAAATSAEKPGASFKPEVRALGAVASAILNLDAALVR